MTDPISGTAASQMAEQAKQVGGDEAGVDQAGSSSETSFDDVMSDVQDKQAEQAEQAGQIDEAEQVDQIDGVEETQKAEGPAQKRLRDFFEEVRTDETKLDEMMERSLNGAEMSQDEMLQMQALIYNYSQKVELTTKAVSNTTEGMKQVMNTQV